MSKGATRPFRTRVSYLLFVLCGLLLLLGLIHLSRSAPQLLNTGVPQIVKSANQEQTAQHESPSSSSNRVYSTDSSAEDKGDTSAQEAQAQQLHRERVGELSCYESELGVVSEYRVAQNLPSAASELIRTYEADGSCQLMQAGYLDLSGKVWSCTILGQDWVDCCIVQELNETESAVYIVRGEPQRWEATDVFTEE